MSQEIRKRERRTAELAPSISERTNNIVEQNDTQLQLINNKLEQITQGVANQSHLLNDKFQELIQGGSNQSEMLHGKLSVLLHRVDNPSKVLNDLEQITQGVANQSNLLNDRFREVIQGGSNQSEMLNGKLNALLHGIDNQSKVLNDRLNVLIAAVDNLSRLLNDKLVGIIEALENWNVAPTSPPPSTHSNVVANDAGSPKTESIEAPGDAEAAATLAEQSPLLIAERTYNTSHPSYDIHVVRNYAGRIFNADLPSQNKAYAALKKLASGDQVADATWAPLIERTLAEVKTNPLTELVLRRREATEQYMAGLGRRHDARYNAGWVNLEDALFLYWLVRKLKPTTILQCGVCNGLSSAFMMLGLAKNGEKGRLHLIDLPQVFNPKDPDWTIPGKTYGEVIPEGRTSAWLVPDAYRKRIDLRAGDSKLLMPAFIDELPAIGMFYHDSLHTYDHMMFEFRQAKRTLLPGGVVVADDIAWNSSLWDFADEHKVPAYNFRGSIGVAFF